MSVKPILIVTFRLVQGKLLPTKKIYMADFKELFFIKLSELYIAQRFKGSLK